MTDSQRPLHNMMQNNRNRRSLSDLPDEVLVVLMQQVPLQQRLVGCARLSRKFERAAVAATTSIKHHAASMDTVHGLQAYLHLHGAVLVSFDLKLPLTGPLGLPFSLQWLPCPGLLKLQLTDSLVQLTSVPGSPQPGILSSCTALTSLCLLNCSVLDLSRELGGLSVLQELQELEVRWDATGSRRTIEAISLLPGALLSQLVRLKSVCLSETMRFASLEHLSRLTDLQRFQVVLAADNEQDRFTGISRLQRLTSLKLDCHQSQQHIGLRVKQTPDIYHLTSLQELKVVGCRVFRPGVLQQMTNLRDVILRMCAMRADDRGTSTLLRMLPLLTALTRLDLTGTLKHPAVKLEDYKPMGKMKNLRVLVLSEGHLPAGMWQQLAAARSPMRNVWSLTINDSHLRLPTGTRLAPKFAKALDTESLSHVVKCFPCLTELSCVASTHADIEWTPLLQLTRLLSVRLSGISNADAPVLASMQRLTSLKIVGPCSITDLGLLKLTALSRLEHLDVTGNLSAALASGVTDQRSTVLSNEAPVGQVPDVSKQLMHLCFKSSVCQAVLLEQLESMEAKLKVREQELRSKAQGVEDRERRVAAAAAQVAAREAECADRWRQLDRRHDNIVAREQQLGAAERHVHAGAQDLGCWEQRMGPAWR